MEHSHFNYAPGAYKHKKGNLSMASGDNYFTVVKFGLPVWAWVLIIVIIIVIIVIIIIWVWLKKRNNNENEEAVRLGLANVSTWDTVRHLWKPRHNTSTTTPVSRSPITNRSVPKPTTKVTSTSVSTNSNQVSTNSNQSVANSNQSVANSNQVLSDMLQGLSKHDTEMLVISTDTGRIREKSSKCANLSALAKAAGELNPKEELAYTAVIGNANNNIFDTICKQDMLNAMKQKIIDNCKADNKQCDSTNSTYKEYIDTMNQSKDSNKKIEDQLDIILKQLKAKKKTAIATKSIDDKVSKNYKSPVDMIKNDPKLKDHFSDTERTYPIAKGISGADDSKMKSFVSLVKKS